MLIAKKAYDERLMADCTVRASNVLDRYNVVVVNRIIVISSFSNLFCATVVITLSIKISFLNSAYIQQELYETCLLKNVSINI